MEEEANKVAGTVSENMTVISQTESSGACGNSVIQVKECADQKEEAGSEQEAERTTETRTSDRLAVCEFPPFDTDNYNNSDTAENRLHDAGKKGWFQQVVRSIRSKSRPTDRDNLEAVEPADSSVAPESRTSTTGQRESESRQVSAQQWDGNDDDEIVRRAREEGCVDVVFPGSVSQDGCCRFVCELLKCVLYQRQQLPMTYDQLVFFQKQQYASTQPEEAAVKKSMKAPGDMSGKRRQQTLRVLDEVLSHMEALFSLTYVPRVLFMLGGSTVLPTELYEINMEALELRGGDRSLRTSLCLRRLFRTLFVADLLSDVKPVRLMATTVMALGHRDCGVDWFKPKVNFRVPTKVKRRVISLASDMSQSSPGTAPTIDWKDYIWFQAPVPVKGFCK